MKPENMQKRLIKSNVLYITYDGITDPLGQSQVIPYVIGLTEKGYNFTILSYEKPDKYKQLGMTIRKQLNDNSIQWRPFRYHKRFSVLATTYDILVGCLYLLFFIPHQKITIIHCRSDLSSILGLMFKKIYGTIFIFDMRGFWADERLEGGIFKRNYLYYFFKYLEKQFIKNAEAVIALTMNAIEEMKTWHYVTEKHSDRFYHITTCCDIKKYSQAYERRIQKKSDIKNLTFIYIGSIGPWHSFPEISGFIKFAYNYLPTSFFKIIINSGKDQFEQFIRSENFNTDRFIFNSVPHHEIPTALENTDIGFFFIPPVYAKKASAPTKLGEMLASGIPVISGHSIGDVDHIVTNNNIGYIVKEFTETEYQNAIDYVVDLIQKDGNELNKRCRKVSDDYFSIDKSIEKYHLIYEKLINEK